MPKRPVLIELYRNQISEEGIVLETVATPFKTNLSMVTEAPDLPGLEIDRSFPAVVVPPPAQPGETPESTSLTLESIDESPDATVLVRAFMEETALESAAAIAANQPGVREIFADPQIEPCPTCINSPAVGNAARVASAVCVSKLRSAGMTGTGVLLAIVDTGVNLPY